MSEVKLKAKLELDQNTILALVREALEHRKYKVRTVDMHVKLDHGDYNQGTRQIVTAVVEVEDRTC